MPVRPSRFWLIWSVAGLVGGIAAQVALYFLPRDYSWPWHITLALGVGVLFGQALFTFTKTIREAQVWRLTRHLPKKIQVEEQEDGSLVCFVETFDGTPRIVTLPEGYDPRDDEGRRLFEILSEPDQA